MTRNTTRAAFAAFAALVAVAVLVAVPAEAKDFQKGELTGSWDTTTRVWDLRSADPSSSPLVLPRTGHEGGQIRLSSQGAVAVSPDGRWLATGSSETQVKLWKLAALDASAEPVELPGHGAGAVTRAGLGTPTPQAPAR